MMKRILPMLATAVLLALPAQAQEGEARLPEDFSEPTRFVAAEHGAHACWAASFDAAEKVTAMQFSITFEDIPPNTDENWPEGRQFFNYELAASLGGGASGTAAGTCHGLSGGGIVCEVECDGGGATIRLDETGNAVVDLQQAGFIRLQACGADGADISLEAAPDDAAYVLTPVPAAECKPIVRQDYAADID